jgi:hypothetical protein
MASNSCVVCGNDILVMCRRGTEVCSENCQKQYDNPGLVIPETPMESEGHHASE